jgi:transcription-repair coupling factor (superfamily II helicase)
MILASATSLPSTPSRSAIIAGCPLAAQPLLLSAMIRARKRSLIHIAASERDAEQLALAFGFIDPELPIYQFPAWDCLPYDRTAPSNASSAERLATLSAMLHHTGDTSYIVITTPAAVHQRIIPQQILRDHVVQVSKGQTLPLTRLTELFTSLGFQRVGKVMEAGEFAVRGSIVDVFAPGHSMATRLDFFGDELESLRSFDPLTQISADPIESLSLHPISEVILSAETIDRFRLSYRELSTAPPKNDPLYDAVSEGRVFMGMEHWLPLFYAQLDTLLDYAPNALVSYDAATPTIITERMESIADYYSARREQGKKRHDEPPYHPVPPERFFLDTEEWVRTIGMRDAVDLSLFNSANDSTVDHGITPAPSLYAQRHSADGNVWELIAQRVKNIPSPTLLACNSQGSLERIEKIAHDHAISTQRIGCWGEIAGAPENTALLTVLPIERGFIHSNVNLFSEQDTLGERIIRTQKRRRASDAFLLEAAGFTPGELVVHSDHGIGRFEGLVTVEAGGARHDCLKLIYAGDDRLFLPVENIDLITRYGTSDEGAELDKLGGVSWQKRKSGLKKRLKMAAEALLAIAAERATRKGLTIAPEASLYDEFASRFPYSETEDQLQSIDDVLEDLRSGRPMDRLICGDVGFGKTEVAMRAAFAAVMHSPEARAQVAIIAPTTLLARQHFRSFQARFADFPITIRPLSRLVSAKEAAITKSMLASGEADIVIGTHALLAKDISFKNLGLVVVDEEQHFGVAQKEKLKQLKNNVHVLTLSATPIPRTLQLALSGVRELSLITTPPVDRLAVRTYVTPYDSVVIREAILREYHRGGRIFYVTPRVKYMAELKQKLHELIPEVSVVSAHGQMPASELDNVMNAFYDGKYDVLLSTAIIESGIDIPTANTMIIDRADMFGLAQLYQLRGRVGRSKTRAYAYFTLPHQKTLSHNATRRLEVMQQLDTLGAGFALASHDMDIRGFGNVLGEEQSGHIREVGIELYQHMLEEAIAEQKRSSTSQTENETEEWSPSINIGSSVLIPETYVSDLQSRLGLYRRAVTLETIDAIEAFAAELVDRFGSLVPEVEHFIEILRIKLWCKKAHIIRLDAGPKGAVCGFAGNQFPRPEKLLTHIRLQPLRFKIRADQKLVIMESWANEDERLRGAAKLAQEIAKLAE